MRTPAHVDAHAKTARHKVDPRSQSKGIFEHRAALITITIPTATVSVIVSACATTTSNPVIIDPPAGPAIPLASSLLVPEPCPITQRFQTAVIMPSFSQTT
ncbi:hypothetical protein NDA18_006141 [Ustilago nuda]|nr:hypothetical protein NDA18_006141 [Ustilago nuda]